MRALFGDGACPLNPRTGTAAGCGNRMLRGMRRPKHRVRYGMAGFLELRQRESKGFLGEKAENAKRTGARNLFSKGCVGLTCEQPFV